MSIEIVERLVSDKKALFKNLGKTSDKEIREHLSRIALVIYTHNGTNTMYGIYEINDELRNKVIARPRNIAYMFDDGDPEKPGVYRKDLKQFKVISVLTPTDGMSFLKPDIGEVFDQMTDEEKSLTKGIYLNHETFELFEGVVGGYHVGKAILHK